MQTKATLAKHVEALKAEVLLLRTRSQCLDVILLIRSQMEMYTGLDPKAFQLLLHWLQPILPCRSKLDTSLHALEEDDEPTSSTPTPYDSQYLDYSQKLLLALMHIKQGLAQEDLAFRFAVDQSSIDPQSMDTSTGFSHKRTDQMAINHHWTSRASLPPYA